MKEKKFRAWCTDNKEMYFADGNYNFVLHQSGAISLTPYRHADELEHYCTDASELDKEIIVMEFTGLRDKNNVEIFEGDLLRYPPNDDWDKANCVLFEVFYHDNDAADNHVGFQFNRLHFLGAICGYGQLEKFLPKYTEKMQVIGNIYQHEHLLKPTTCKEK